MSTEILPGTTVARSGSARLPTSFGEFKVTAYHDSDGKEHLAVAMGELSGEPLLLRLHSECLTGDVFSSRRCDCGEQLHVALQRIAQEGRGLLLYLRQEGRGIGLNNKILAYALQDQGMDTVEANLHLGLPADGRSYLHAAEILKDLGVNSVRLATNNPEKVKALEDCGIRVVERVRFLIAARPENVAYLKTKVAKMGHLLNPWPLASDSPDGNGLANGNGTSESGAKGVPSDGAMAELNRRLRQTEGRRHRKGLPAVTLSYAQSLDGAIASNPGQPLQLSNPQSQILTHRMRSMHDAVLVGINTVLSDDPRLTARIPDGKNPQPIVLDGRLRTPLTARLLHPPCVPPIIATTTRAGAAREEQLQAAGARVLRLPTLRNGLIDLRKLLRRLHQLGIRSLMVEGGSQVITEFLRLELVDQLIITIAPRVVGGLHAFTPLLPPLAKSRPCRLINVQYHPIAGDLIVIADLEKPTRPLRPSRKPSRVPPAGN